MKIFSALLFILIISVTTAQAEKSRYVDTLENPYSAKEISAMGGHIKFVGINPDFGGAVNSARAIKNAGKEPLIYHIGSGGGSSWGEKHVNLTNESVLNALVRDAANIKVRYNARYIHLDNVLEKPSGESYGCNDMLKIAGRVFDKTGVYVIPKNNITAFLCAYSKRPEIAPRGAISILEHGTFLPEQLTALVKMQKQYNMQGNVIEFRKGDWKSATSGRMKMFASKYPGIQFHLLPSERRQGNWGGYDMRNHLTFSE